VDATAAQILSTKLEADVSSLAVQQKEALARLAAAVGVPVASLAKIRVEQKWDLPLITEILTNDLRQAALCSRPDILSALAEYAASQSALQLEIAKQYPDLRLGTGYQYDQGEHKWSLGLSMDLPVLNRNEGPIAEAKAARVASAARFEAVQAQVMAELDRASASYEGALAQEKSLEALMDQQQKQRASVESQFKAGAADQLEMVNARIEESAAGLLRFEAKIKALQAFGQLEDAIQRPLPAMAGLEKSPKISSNSLP